MYFVPRPIIVWVKFYLLTNALFRDAFVEEYDVLNQEFFHNYSIGDGGLKGDGLDFDCFVNDDNIETLLAVIDNILGTKSFNEKEIYKLVLDCPELKIYSESKVRKFFNENIFFNENEQNYNLKTHFETIRKALKQRSFYELASIGIESLLGEWRSVAETGAIAFNYNMTDFMALGKSVRLVIAQYDEKHYTFTCFGKVVDYTNSEESEIALHDSIVRMQDGYLHHYYKDIRNGFYFSHVAPVYDFTDRGFSTQVQDVGFTFEKDERNAY